MDRLCLLETSAEEYKQRTFAFTIACVVETVAVGLSVLACVWFPHQLSERTNQYALITLPSLTEQKPILKLPPPPKIAAPEVKLLRPPAPVIVPVPSRRAPPIEKPETQAKLAAPNASKESIPAIAAPPLLPLAPPATPVRTGLFSPPVERSASEYAPVRNIATDTFSHPQVLVSQEQAGAPGNVPKLGAFDSSAAPGKPNGTGSRENPRTVATAGFRSGEQYTITDEMDERNRRSVREAGFGGGEQYVITDDMNQRNRRSVREAGFAGGERYTISDDETAGRKTVAAAGFGGASASDGVRGPGGAAPAAVKTGAFGATPQTSQAPAKPRAAPAGPKIQPVEILSKPLPQYTEEARRLRVQGEVVLSVVFRADGTLKVVRVIKSLGYGLDQMAEHAAAQIRFKPAEQADKPMDFPATLHIEFRLA
jgi:TonB family protein